MAETTDTTRDDAGHSRPGEAMNAPELEAWFVREVLPLEAALMQFLQHNWRNQADIADIRQDVYERVCLAAQDARPDNAKAFLFRTARNLLIDRIRREHVVPIEAVEDVDALSLAMEEPGPERSAIARDELRRLQAALDRLPPRAREAIVLGRIEGLQGNEIAQRMGITEGVVSRHLASGISALADMLYGEDSKPRRKP